MNATKTLAMLLALSALLASGAAVSAEGGRRERVSPYWVAQKNTQPSDYGENRPVKNLDEARLALREHFAGKDVRVTEIRDRGYFFEARVVDKSGRLVDRVIIDKRTGRIRSIY